MKGVIKREFGTGRTNWLIQPLTEPQASILINWEDGQHLTEKNVGIVVDYIVEDVQMGISTFRLARIKSPELRNADGTYNTLF